MSADPKSGQVLGFVTGKALSPAWGGATHGASLIYLCSLGAVMARENVGGVAW